jgi:indolepyruvate ferredoxin oxidoreductase
MRANGVSRIALVSDDPGKFDARDFPEGVTIDSRLRLDAVQRQLREIPGVSVLIYEQECATERRRRRKRGQAQDPQRFVYINDLVCEGCGDCSVESNCLSVEPKETQFGRKRRINQSACNKDFSCINGFCPSFVTVEGAVRRKNRGPAIDVLARTTALSEPKFATLEVPFNLLVTGVGGTGVITLGALVAMAAHLEGKGASVLDFTGFAQKFGPVLSFIRLAATPADIHQVRIDHGAADALIGCDIVVSSSAKASTTYRPTMRAVVNLAEMPTGDVVRNRDAGLAASERLRRIEALIGAHNLFSFDANQAARRLFGDTLFANMIMLGAAWQQGLVPVSLAALMRAIELNGAAVEDNKRAFASGRLAVADSGFAASLEGTTRKAETLDEIIARRAEFLRAYQNAAYASLYLRRVDDVRATENSQLPGSSAFTTAAALSLFKLMAYKDEYEVGRLHRDAGFREGLRQEFEGEFTITHHLAPPIFASGRDARGRPLKRQFGTWVQPVFGLLARLKFLRGTAFDVFGYTRERRRVRELLLWYNSLIDELLPRLGPESLDQLVKLASLPMDIRGYGPVKETAVKSVKSKIEAMKGGLASPVPPLDATTIAPPRTVSVREVSGH